MRENTTPASPATAGTRQCSSCKEVKHVLAFAADRQNPDGMRRDCRDCCNARNAVYYRAKIKPARRRLPFRDAPERVAEAAKRGRLSRLGRLEHLA